LWAVPSFAALVVIYWISTLTLHSHLEYSSDWTIDTLVITIALLAPVPLFGERDERAEPMLNP
jgi:hypothetical protein